MYKIIIKKLVEYDETITAYKDPKNPDMVYYSKYDVEESLRDSVKSHQRPTGKKLYNESQIFEQIVDELNMVEVIKSINEI